MVLTRRSPDKNPPTGVHDAQARNIVGDVGHARFVFIRAVGAALGDETRPIAKQREVGAQALGGRQSSK